MYIYKTEKSGMRIANLKRNTTHSKISSTFEKNLEHFVLVTFGKTKRKFTERGTFPSLEILPNKLYVKVIMGMNLKTFLTSLLV